MISITHSNPSSTISSSSKDSWEDQSTQSLSHNEDPQHTSSPMRSLSSSLGESSALNSPIQSDSTGQCQYSKVLPILYNISLSLSRKVH
ncbi:hypothetical protein ACGC1H_003957 [Rhizoctonia solani]